MAHAPTSAAEQTLNGTLSPPQVRQPFTPPPQKELDEQHTHTEHLPSDKAIHVDVEDLSICANPSARLAIPKRRQKASQSDAQSLGAMLRHGVVQHQLGLSVNFMLMVVLSYALFPSLREHLTAFFRLSYKFSDSDMCGQGTRDSYLVASFVVLFIAVRAFLLDYVLTPLAQAAGIRQGKARVRFAEQGFMLLYYAVYSSWGLYLFVRDTPASLPVEAAGQVSVNDILLSLWTYFPRLAIHWTTKVYYLSQLGSWIAQIVTIHLEERRKDHYQMLSHHLFTVALMSTSYGYRQTRVGTAVLVCMDFVDFVFAFAKIMRYVGWQTTCDIAFGAFVIAWLCARHIAYGAVCWSIWAHVGKNVMPYGQYSLSPSLVHSQGIVSGRKISSDGGDSLVSEIFQPFVNPTAQTVEFNSRVRWGFLALLGGLQCITILWFFMICRVVVRVLRGEGADDTRSDDEGEDDVTDEKDDEDGIDEAEILAPHQASVPQPSIPYTLPEQKYIEVETSPADLAYSTHAAGSAPRRVASTSAKRKTFSSGLHLGEHKEILNRIGCLSDEQLARERQKREGSASPRPGAGTGK